MNRFAALMLGFAIAIPAQEPPTIRVETRLVEVDVVVRGSKGAVDNLTADDFTIYDRNRRQKIVAFAMQRESDRPALRPLAFANRTYRDAVPVAPTVILLDTLNSKPEDMLELRRQLGLYLQRSAPNEPVAIYSLNKELTVVQDFTQDIERLRGVIARWTATHSTDMAPDMRFLEDLLFEPFDSIALSEHERAMLENILREVTSMTLTRRADLTAYAFEEIAAHLAGIPGRKKLIWAGGSFPAQVIEQRGAIYGKGSDTRNYARLLTGAIQALNAANVAVYPMDPRNPAEGGNRDPDPTKRANDSGQRNAGIDTMNIVANGTGGKAFYALTDLAGAVQQAMQDSNVTYRLAFTPSDYDGKYHELRVEVRGLRGAEVRHRKGYLAAESKPPTAVSLSESLKQAMEAPLDVTAIGLAAEPIATDPGQPKQFVLRIDVRDLEIGIDRIARISLTTHYPNSMSKGSSVSMDLTFTEARLKDVLANGYLGRVVVEHPNEKQVRFTVQDRATGRAGTLTIDLKGDLKGGLSKGKP